MKVSTTQSDERSLCDRFLAVRAQTRALCDPLHIEDYVVQPMRNASPAKWHLAHTTWFFDRFVLQELLGARAYDESYNHLFNSYYNAVGEPFERARRGMITRPGVAQVYAYRASIEGQLAEVLRGGDVRAQVRERVEVGINHEQQHQELLLTDLKYLMWQNPSRPAVFVREEEASRAGGVGPLAAARPGEDGQDFEAGVYEIGHVPPGFSYDNECPRHKVYLGAFRLGARLVNCAEYLAFMQDGGYQRPEFWLAEGWAMVQQEGWESPLYWEKVDGVWHVFTLSGRRPVRGDEPVVHVSYYEANAFAEWAGARLATEQEWEVAVREQPLEGNLLESHEFHPRAPREFHPRAPAADGTGIAQGFGDVWEWTASAYLPYPGFRPLAGALGEYNAKFMCGQHVLRGGSCATAQSHIRPTYRNFFHPDARWQFSGIRLAW